MQIGCKEMSESMNKQLNDIPGYGAHEAISQLTPW